MFRNFFAGTLDNDLGGSVKDNSKVAVAHATILEPYSP